MILSSVVIAGALGVGTVSASLKAYREKKRKKEFPWTVYAEKIERRKRKRLTGGLVQGTLATFDQFKEEQIMPFFASGRVGTPDIRQQQLLQMASSNDETESDAEKEMNRYLALSTTALTLTVASMFYTPLSLISVPVLAIAGLPVLKVTAHSVIKEKKVSVGLVDVICIVGPLAMGHYLAASLFLTFWCFSRKLMLKTEDHSRKSLINVFGEQPKFVWIEQNGSDANTPIEVEVRIDEVQVGDIVVVHAGQTISFDGMISHGRGTIDERTLTGESQPVEKGMGEQVFASTILLSGRIGIQVQKAGHETVAAQIGEMLNRTADFKLSTVSRGEKIVDFGARPTLALSALALPVLGSQSALGVLFASFGYHMRVSAPISVLSFLRMASENGVLIKDGRSLELLSQVDTIVFDKTGTLTEEVPTVGQIYVHRISEAELLTLAAAAEYKQTHPIALAIRREAQKRELNIPSIHETQVEIGYGIKVSLQEGINQGKLIRVGSGRFMEMSKIAIPEEYEKIEEAAHAEGHSLVYVAIDNQLGGAIELRPTIRPEAKQITSALRERGIEMVIISGDHQRPTKKLAESLGIERYFAQVLPQDKAALVEQLQQACPGPESAKEGRKGKSVCFIGDGINDSIALKKANVSISLRGASTAATDTAGIILMDGSLKQLVSLLELANELDHHLTTSTIMSILPGIICVGGVFFFHFGLISSIIVYNIGLVANVSNALLPLTKHQRKKQNRARRSVAI